MSFFNKNGNSKVLSWSKSKAGSWEIHCIYSGEKHPGVYFLVGLVKPKGTDMSVS